MFIKFYWINSIINCFIFFIFKKLNYVYLPNLLINNTIYINPNKIEFINSIPMKFHKSSKFIIDFDWDLKNKKIYEHEKLHHTYIGCYDLFVEKKNIKECKEFFFFKSQIKEYGVFKNCTNENDLIIYFKKLINLYQNIKNFGYKSSNKNIEFMIDKNLNLVKINAGNHRFAIARILKLKKIPIDIKLIHSKNLSEISNVSFKKINLFIKSIERKYN